MYTDLMLVLGDNNERGHSNKITILPSENQKVQKTFLLAQVWIWSPAL